MEYESPEDGYVAKIMTLEGENAKINQLVAIISDDLSSFRATIVNVKNTQKPMFAIEVGRAGLVMRGLSPVFDNNHNYVGSVELILGLK
jgi:pyruvate/2-oxoglutarate dehydrogenase complex dihydrolipoamide acyltransferase (E2) component